LGGKSIFRIKNNDNNNNRPMLEWGSSLISGGLEEALKKYSEGINE